MFSKAILIAFLSIALSGFTANAAPAKGNNVETCGAVSTVTVTATPAAASTGAVLVSTGNDNNGKGGNNASNNGAAGNNNNNNNQNAASSVVSDASSTVAAAATSAATTGKGNKGGKGAASSVAAAASSTDVTAVSSTAAAAVTSAATTGNGNTGKGNKGGKGAASSAAAAASSTDVTAASSSAAAAAAATSAAANTGKGNNGKGGKGGAAASSAAAAATSSAANASNTAAAGGNNAASGDLQTSLTLDKSVVATGFANNGQDVPAAGQVASLTSTNNFINFCATTNKPITNGQQIKTGSCNPAPMGVIAATTNMPSSKFTFPQNMGTVQANTAFTITMAISNLETGNFVNAQENYFSAPQQTSSSGTIQGHSHVVIEKLDSLTQTTPTDPTVFAFFKGLNDAAQGGVLSADVTSGLPAGAYRLASINSAANHQPVLVAIAQHGTLDDMVYFTVTADGKAAGGAAAGAANSTSAATSAAAAAATSAAAGKGNNKGTGNGKAKGAKRWFF